MAQFQALMNQIYKDINATPEQKKLAQITMNKFQAILKEDVEAQDLSQIHERDSEESKKNESNVSNISNERQDYMENFLASDQNAATKIYSVVS